MSVFFFQSSVNQSCFYVKDQTKNQSSSAFHFSAWELLAGCVQKANEWGRREMQTLKFHYLFTETARSQIQYFSDLGTQGFQIFLFFWW